MRRKCFYALMTTSIIGTILFMPAIALGTYLCAEGNQLWSQDSLGIEGGSETGDRFGQALGYGDFNGDGYAELAIGIPNGYISSADNAGALKVFYGCTDLQANVVLDYVNLELGDPKSAHSPPSVPADWEKYTVQTNPGRCLVFDMGGGEEIPDMSGYDFYVGEADAEAGSGFANDPYEVYVSNDAATWYYLGLGRADTEFDINGALPEARYVKLLGVTRNSEIEAIEIIDYPAGWWRGNTHTHSTISDGNQTPDEVAAHYKNLGYDFLVLTDHNMLNWLHFFKICYAPNFLCINGEEITDPSNHTNGIGLTSRIDPGNLQNNVSAVLAQGGIPHLNHPTSSLLDVGELYPIEDLKFMEIYNALDADVTNDEELWDDLLSLGKLMYGIASDDCHDTDSEAGRAWIVVRAPALTLEDILTAIDAGDFYASTGVILNDYRVDENSMIVDSRNGDLIEFIGLDGDPLESVEDSYAEYAFQGTEYYVRARILNTQTGEQAWCQPILGCRFELRPECDSDVDRISDDGDFNGVAGDNPCTDGEIESCDDNCPNIPNGPDNGTCITGDNIGNKCMDNTNCGTGGFCSMNQENNDSDGEGDACDPDDDNDGICDPGESDPSCSGSDNCQYVVNPDQKNNDTDGIGDVCDNCPEIPNSPDNGTCTAGDEGNPCKSNDGCGTGGFCSMNQEDSDNDTVGDVCDNCPKDYNLIQTDCDEDGTGDACDEDTFDFDGDGIDDGEGEGHGCDNCPEVYNPDQEDSDGNGIGDDCELCSADFNDNGKVDAGDMYVLVDEANASLRNCDSGAMSSPPCCYADANGDGRIDGMDMFIVVNEANASRRNCPIISHCPNVPR